MTIRRATEDIDLGYGKYDSEKYDNRPKVQILTPAPKPKRLQIRVCTKCNGQVAWIKESHRFICYSCGIVYHEDFTSLPTSNDASIRPLQSVDPYEKIEPALISVKVDKPLQGQQKDNDTQISGDLRRARITTTNLTKALSEEWIRSQLQQDYAYGY